MERICLHLHGAVELVEQLKMYCHVCGQHHVDDHVASLGVGRGRVGVSRTDDWTLVLACTFPEGWGTMRVGYDP